MEYTDNPRKLYGKVEVIFSDTDIARDVETEESSDSAISHPKEVATGDLVPTTRACTMEGNSVMDGSFQMMDDSCCIGWWGGVLSNADGSFTNNQYIELTFLERPVTTWVLVGDSKLGQYPVDFTVTFKSHGAVVKTLTYTNNTQMQVRINETVEAVTGIRLTISKWSKGNAVVKILRFYDTLSETYEGDNLLSFEVGEELANKEGSYSINSDTATVQIFNRDRKFDRGYLKSLLVLDRKIKPYIGIERNGEIIYKSLGTYYSDEWTTSQDSQWVKCQAVDKLYRLQKKTYVGMNVTRNTNLYAIVEDIMQKAGYASAKYSISESLKAVSIPMGFMPKESVWDALQEVANAGLCKVYVDRDDRIVIRSESDAVTDSRLEVNKSNMFSYSSSISQVEFANRVSVQYCDVSISEETEDAAETEVTLAAGESIDLSIDYDSEIADAVISVDNTNLRLLNFQSGIDACTVTVRNDAASAQSGTITVTGKKISVTNKKLMVQDEQSILESGTIDYNHPSTNLIQSYAYAMQLAGFLLNKMSAGEGVIDTTWRGNPELELGMKYVAKDRFDDESILICEYNKFTFDGGLRQETRGRKI